MGVDWMLSGDCMNDFRWMEVCWLSGDEPNRLLSWSSIMTRAEQLGVGITVHDDGRGEPKG